MIVTIFGGTGFIGSDIVRVLAKQGYIIRVAEPYPKRADRLKFNGSVGQIVPVACDYSPKSIESALDGAAVAINCTGVLTPRKGRSFMGTHCTLPEMIAKACAKKGLRQFIHISALGIDGDRSAYARSKLAGEKAIQKAFDSVTILRPSIVFGPRDNFFNRFAALARILPALPLIGGGKTLFQPVYVGDIARATADCIRTNTFGIIECGGPDVVSFKGLLETMKSVTGSHVCLLPMPFWMARLQASMMSVLPSAPITLDQIRSLQSDHIVSGKTMTLTDLGITPTSMDAVLPKYL